MVQLLTGHCQQCYHAVLLEHCVGNWQQQRKRPAAEVWSLTRCCHQTRDCKIAAIGSEIMQFLLEVLTPEMENITGVT